MIFEKLKRYGTTILFFLILCIIAYLPISSFLFYIKNDSFLNYFPPKFFISESLSDGFLPLWNPYINFGIPQYADMNAGYWSPITWAIASTMGYNVYSFTLELLMYIFIGGIGMYLLTGFWVNNKHIKLMAGLSFICCGYNVAHLQHFNWISGAAFLPFCLFFYLQFLKKSNGKNCIISAIFFYLFCASAHPGLIIGSLYFFLAITINTFLNNKKESLERPSKLITLKWHFILLGLIILLCSGIIIGYSDVIPHFIRGEKVALQNSLPHSSNWKTWMSFLLPLPTSKNTEWFATELTLRNSYFGLLFFWLFCTSFLFKRTKWESILLGLGLFFLLLSSGTIITKLSHQYLPYIGYVRLNGEFRIFALIPFILLSAIQLDKLLLNKENFTLKSRPVSILFYIFFLSALLIGTVGIINSEDSIVIHLKNLSNITNKIDQLKFIIDHLSFYDTLILQSLLQIFVFYLMQQSIRVSHSKRLLWLVIVDLIIATLLYIPFTGVGKNSLSFVDSIIAQSPKGIPIPALHPIVSNKKIRTDQNNIIGSWDMFGKQPGTIKEVPYPIQLKNMRKFFDSLSPEERLFYFKKPFLFSEDSLNKVKLLSYTPNKMVVSVYAESISKLVIQQNYYPHWFYTNKGFKENRVNKEGVSFMAVPLELGQNKIEIYFSVAKTKWALLISFISLGVLLFILLLISLRSQKN